MAHYCAAAQWLKITVLNHVISYKGTQSLSYINPLTAFANRGVKHLAHVHLA